MYQNQPRGLAEGKVDEIGKEYDAYYLGGTDCQPRLLDKMNIICRVT